jgi:putative transcriptional regulator
MVKVTDLLIAPPQMPDPRFRDTVLMITAHSHWGSRAVCVNRPLGATLDQVLQGHPWSLPPTPVYWGGPVNTHSLWMLHSTDWQCAHSQQLSESWAVTSHARMLDQLTEPGGPRYSRFMLGHAGWAPGQLQAELEGGQGWSQSQSWLTADNLGVEWLLEQSVEDVWNNTIMVSCHQAVDSWL